MSFNLDPLKHATDVRFSKTFNVIALVQKQTATNRCLTNTLSRFLTDVQPILTDNSCDRFY